ncbi:MAG: hypothetical protein GX596_04475 [Propionibacterium sp.]|nr:hypothetical protein [Propionibacterium sp.]
MIQEKPKMNHLESRLRAIDPASDLKDREQSFGEMATLMAREIVKDAPRPVTMPSEPQKRRHRGLIIGVVAAVVLGVPTAVAANQLWQARTGTYGNVAASEEDSSEWLDLCAVDFGEYITHLAPDLELPPTTTWAELSSAIAREAANDTSCSEFGARAQSRFFDLAQGAWLHHAIDL